MFAKTILFPGIVLGTVLTSMSLAQAASTGVMTCRPHEWQRFADAVAAQDNEELARMLTDPEIANCNELYLTVQVLTCNENPMACIAPSAGPSPIPVDIDDTPPTDNLFFGPDGPFPGQRPGEQAGNEQDRDDNSSPADPGNPGGGDGGNTPSRSNAVTGAAG
ncbi:MAG: hypothetical protein R3F55_20230 [Alphaproteobacteria bacterium]